MGRRDGLYLLKDMVEYDEGYVEVATKKQIKNQLKRGKGSQRQAQVAVAVESTPLENPESGQGSKVCGYFKMEVLNKVDSENVNQFIKRNTVGEVVLFTDRNTAYVNLEKVVDTHFTVAAGKEETNDDAEAMRRRATRSDARRCICRYHFGTRINPAVSRSNKLQRTIAIFLIARGEKISYRI